MKPLILFSFVFLTIVSLSLQPLHAQAPIPNGDFENWNGNTPTGWLVDDTTVAGTSYNPITKTSDSHSGSFALEGTAVGITFGGTVLAVIPPSAITGEGTMYGFPYTDQPNSFMGWYKFTPVAGDSITITCLFLKNGNGIGEGIFSTSASASSYTQFDIPINWATNEAPDSANVEILMYAGSSPTAYAGSTFEVDDLAFSNQIVGGNAVAPSEVSSFDLGQNYPNPLTNAISTTIAYSLDEPGYTTLTVYDINGRTVATPVQEVQSAGNHLAALNCGELAAGVYTYRLTCGDHSVARMMQVLH